MKSQREKGRSRYFSDGGGVPLPRPRPKSDVPIPKPRPKVHGDPSRHAARKEAAEIYYSQKYPAAHGYQDYESYGKFRELKDRGQQDLKRGGRT